MKCVLLFLQVILSTELMHHAKRFLNTIHYIKYELLVHKRDAHSFLYFKYFYLAICQNHVSIISGFPFLDVLNMVYHLCAWMNFKTQKLTVKNKSDEFPRIALISSFSFQMKQFDDLSNFDFIHN